MKIKALLVVCFCLFALISHANKTYKQNNSFEIQKLNDSLIIITDKEYGTYIGVVIGESSIVVINPMPSENLLEDLNSEIKKHSSLSVEYVINTHNHEYHAGGNEFFKVQGAIIIN